MKIRLTIAMAALGVAATTMLGVAAAAPADAATGGTFMNYNSGDCLGILGGADDAPAVQWACDGSANQA